MTTSYELNNMHGDLFWTLLEALIVNVEELEMMPLSTF